MDNSNFRWLVSALAAAAVAVAAIYAASAGRSKIYMNGPLSSKHAAMEQDCAKCHTPWKGITDKGCASCHGDKRHTPGRKTGKENPDAGGCPSCHVEHKGRFRNIRLVKNEKCLICHKSEAHPGRKKSAADKHNPADFGVDCAKCHVGVKHPAGIDLSTEFVGLGRKGFSHAKHLQRDNIASDNCDMCHEKSDASGPFKMASLENACGACHSMYGGDGNKKPASVSENCPACHISGETKIVESLKPLKPMKAFAHSRHVKNKCMDCHGGAAKSDVMADFTPKIEKCMDCHNKQMASNDCGVCHPYHTRK